LATCAIFAWLKNNRNYQFNLDIDFCFTHAADLVENIIERRISRPEFCGVVLAPALTLLNQENLYGYKLNMLLPKQGYRVIGSPHNRRLNKGDSNLYIFAKDGLPGAIFQYERLIREGALSKSKTSTEHVDPDHILQTIKDADSRTNAVVWTPYSELVDMMQLGATIDNADRDNRWEDVVLLVRSSFERHSIGKVRSLNLAMRSAWIDLLESGTSVEQAIEYLMSDPAYVFALRRALGIYCLELKS